MDRNLKILLMLVLGLIVLEKLSDLSKPANAFASCGRQRSEPCYIKML